MNDNKTDPTAAADTQTEGLVNPQDPRTFAQERDKYQELYLRSQAEFDNYQKRNRRELETERQYALTPLARDLVPIIDNLERALAAAKDGGPLVQGVRMVHTQLSEALKRHNIRPIEAVGEALRSQSTRSRHAATRARKAGQYGAASPGAGLYVSRSSAAAGESDCLDGRLNGRRDWRRKCRVLSTKY